MTDTPRPPNVLFVFADQLGAEYMGCYGHPVVRTPNLNRLAGESVFFRNACTTSPLCTPFRGVLFTGRYPVQTGILCNSQGIPVGETTLADRFEDGGYATCYVGKWHLVDQPRAIWVPPEKRGGFRDFVGWDCGHVQHWNQAYFDGDDPAELTLEGHETDALTDLALERLRRNAAGDRPFCQFVSYQAPHPVCEPPPEFHDLYRGKDLALRPNVDPEARFTGYGHYYRCEVDPVDWTERYFGEITHLDAAVGRLLNGLDEAGLRDNTIVVFTSDHGDMGGSHGRFEKQVAYEEATHVPLMIRLPGQGKGRETAERFSTIDFLPTLLDLCGLPVAENAEGNNRAALVRDGTTGQGNDPLILQWSDSACIRVGSAKLTLGIDGEQPTMLFHLDRDPYEEHNLVDDPSGRDTVAELQQRYRAWLASATEAG